MSSTAPRPSAREAISWESANPSVATINQSGVISAKAVGTTTIKLTYKGFATNISVTVTAS